MIDADRGVVADGTIDDMAEAVQLLAGAVGELAIVLTADPATREQALMARRVANAAERVTERVLLGL